MTNRPKRSQGNRPSSGSGDCFAQAGVKIPRRRNGAPMAGACACGAEIRFDIATHRANHFLVCPVVDKAVTDAQAPIELDAQALAAGLQLAHRLQWLQ